MNNIDITRLFCVGTLATVSLFATADDSIPLHRSALEGGRARYEQTALSNPALKVVSLAPSQSVVSLAGVTEPSAQARIPQLGKGGRCFQVEAASFSISMITVSFGDRLPTPMGRNTRWFGMKPAICCVSIPT